MNIATSKYKTQGQISNKLTIMIICGDISHTIDVPELILVLFAQETESRRKHIEYGSSAFKTVSDRCAIRVSYDCDSSLMK